MCWIQTSYLTSDCLQIWRCKTYYYFPVALEIFSRKVHSFERYSRSKFSCYELHMLPNEVVCTYLTIQILQGAVQKNHRFESILKYPKCFVGVRIDINRQLWNFCIKCIFASLHQIQVILSKYKYQLTALWLGKSVLKNCTRASTASLFPSIKELVENCSLLPYHFHSILSQVSVIHIVVSIIHMVVSTFIPTSENLRCSSEIEFDT